MEPLVYGDYPFTMRAIVRERLPYFTKEEAEMVRRSYDFIGVNYYTARYAQGLPFPPNPVPTSYTDDAYVNSLGTCELDNGIPLDVVLNDQHRIKYHKWHLHQILEAMGCTRIANPNPVECYLSKSDVR
ncbi:hypothetical protein Taro_045776 [Colocasia esculenta]|uniref:Beta-glucosidase n=1 Tax=Colocasia esculenta TaxID=4460 RepID=A0A843X0W8_COLES|nr:hypothetical protein [Colocasia esculenta]